MAAEAHEVREMNLMQLRYIPSVVHMLKCPFLSPGDHLILCDLNRQSESILTVRNVSSAPSLMILLGLLKQSQVFQTLRHASWPSENSSDGKMDPSSDWGISAYSPLHSTKGKRLILQLGIPSSCPLSFLWSVILITQSYD